MATSLESVQRRGAFILSLFIEHKIYNAHHELGED